MRNIKRYREKKREVPATINPPSGSITWSKATTTPI